MAWVNNQFQQYVYDVTELVASPLNGDANVTVAFESAWLYGLNVTSNPDVEFTKTIDVRCLILTRVVRMSLMCCRHS